MWWMGAAAVWLLGACAVALVLGAVLRRGHCTAPAAPPEPEPAPVRVPAQRSAPPATPPHGLRSQGHLSCVASVRPRP